jgi:hypothetical protein
MTNYLGGTRASGTPPRKPAPPQEGSVTSQETDCAYCTCGADAFVTLSKNPK